MATLTIAIPNDANSLAQWSFRVTHTEHRSRELHATVMVSDRHF